ncbi:hypothetical protein C6I20_07120 [Aeromicrobium sp. A1-2]|uniref:hypothetical protein n=1 Tax=Aeromicrobium sp. A1-2 TaxID=2107713 RepID=UPI000E546988|nr:hypothetical protein [Aeromicrobium sp. A1-2]AXT84979.1 hypothetical protein C6I20_07120 [Aeromicrobium sp. A1-2]
MSDTSHGFGRALVAIYAVFAVAASARSIFQLTSKAGDAPFAYSLSAFAGIVYVVATVALARSMRTLALVTISIELVGVLVTGVLSLADDALFPDQTVWSSFGAGYVYVPLALPLVGMWWLRRTASSGHD